MAKSKGPSTLSRYTSLPVALDVLSEKRITLLSPDLWEDRNDAYYLERYKEQGGFTCVLAVCFSQSNETCHHWQVFSHGFSGVRIEFDKKALLTSVPTSGDFRSREVVYRLIQTVRNNKPNMDDWPFLKRKPYKNEAEFRIVYQSKADTSQVKHVGIELVAIRRVTLSPWLPESIAESVKETISRIDGCSRLKVFRSSLIENSSWKNAID